MRDKIIHVTEKWGLNRLEEIDRHEIELAISIEKI